MEYSGVKYRYIHNRQGGAIGIIDDGGNPVVEYKYDAWGKSHTNASQPGIVLHNLGLSWIICFRE